ncbi:MAG: MMPL family transporter [Balneolales bacterium]|nr:MMPL family transporter [Balneolales bacterium]
MERLAVFILGNRKPILITAVILALLSIYPVLQIEADFSLEGFFPENDPTIDAYQSFSEEYGRDDNVIVIGLEHNDILSDAFLDELRSFTGSLIEVSFVSEVLSLLDAQRLVNIDGSLRAESYFPNGKISDPETLKRELLFDPFTEGILINDDATFTAIYLFIDEEDNHFPERQQLIGELNELVSEMRANGFEVFVAGIPFFRNQYVNVLNQEIIFYISISSVLIILLLWFLFRNAQGIVIPIMIVWLTILFTVVILYLSGGYFEVLTSTIAPILLCVGVADSVHMLSKYRDNRLAGMLRSRAMKESLIVLGSATFLTSVTTAVGFATLLTSNVIPMRTFGLYTAIGVMVAYIITIFLLPSMMPYFSDKIPGSTGSIPGGRVHNAIGAFLRHTFRISIRYHKAVVIVTLLVTVGIGTGISQLKVNGFVFDDVGQDSPLIADSHIIGERLSPQFPLEILIDTGIEDGVSSPDLLSRVALLEEKLLSYPEFAKTRSLRTLIERVHMVMSPEEAETEPLPQNQQLIAQYLLLMEITDGEALEQFTDFTYQQIRVSTQAFDAGSHRVNQIRSELIGWLDEHFPDENITLTGTTILVADLTDNIVFSLASSIMLAFVFISLIMARLFRNTRLVIISLLPNIMPLVVVAGIMGYFGIDIKPSTAVIFTIAFGIAVDDSIHYLARFRIELQRGRTLLEAMRITTERTGRAILLTSAILLVGFGTLGNSEFDSTMYMGQLVSLTIFMAIVADLFFLPALIYWIKPDINLGAPPAKYVANTNGNDQIATLNGQNGVVKNDAITNKTAEGV